MEQIKTYTPDFVTVQTQPTGQVVTLDELKDHVLEVPEGDAFLAAKLIVATEFVEDIIKTWLRPVTLKAVSQRIPTQLYLPGGRIQSGSVSANLVGVENEPITDFYLFFDSYNNVLYLNDIPDFTIRQTRLEVQYSIEPYDPMPEPIKEAIKKVVSHLYDVRGIQGAEVGTSSLATPLRKSFPKSEITLLLKPWIKKSGFKKMSIR